MKTQRVRQARLLMTQFEEEPIIDGHTWTDYQLSLSSSKFSAFSFTSTRSDAQANLGNHTKTPHIRFFNNILCSTWNSALYFDPLVSEYFVSAAFHRSHFAVVLFSLLPTRLLESRFYSQHIDPTSLHPGRNIEILNDSTFLSSFWNNFLLWSRKWSMAISAMVNPSGLTWVSL